MQPNIGYLTKYESGLYGERGLYYDYVLAGNGVFIEAESSLMAARIPVSEGIVRGLADAEPKVVLRPGPIAQIIFDTALALMLVGSHDYTIERYMAVTWNGFKYDLFCPEQEGNKGEVAYEIPADVILDLHSHMNHAFFSSTDNADEQGFKVYGVIGLKNMEVKLRVGVYGYFYDVLWSDIFSGSLVDVRDVNCYPTIKEEEEYEIIFPPGLIGWLQRNFRR